MKKLDIFLNECYLPFINRFGAVAEYTSVAPGRINIIGDHTDYNQGLAMPAAIDRWVSVGFRWREDREVTIRSDFFKEEVQFDLAAIPEKGEGWTEFIIGGLNIFQEKYSIERGFDALVFGNIPVGAGLSSSAALEVAWMNGLRHGAGVEIAGKDLCRLCQRIEHEYLGVQSGLLDQYASLFSKPGELMLIDFKADEIRSFSADMADWTWLTVNSMVDRKLADGKYQERVQETAFGLKEMGLEDFREVNMDNLWKWLEDPTLEWPRRLRHYVTENARVVLAKKHLEEGRFWELGLLLNASHYNLKQNYRVSCPELDFLQETALTFHACAGARMMGGGFGGCTLNLVKSAEARNFSKYLSETFKAQFGVEPMIDQFELMEGASIIPANN